MTRSFSIAICMAVLSLSGCGVAPPDDRGSPTSQKEEPTATQATPDALHTSPDCLIVPADDTKVSWGHQYIPSYVDHGGECRYEAILDIMVPSSGYRAGFVTQPMEISPEACANTRMVGKAWGWNGSSWVTLYETPNPVVGWMDHQICQAWLETPPLDTTGISIVRMVGHSWNWVIPLGISMHWMPFT